jgi:streptogrisin C
MKKSVFGVRFVSAPLALAVAMIVTATPALAADDDSAAVRAAMQRDLGLSPAQLSQYLKIERLSEQSQRLEKRQGAHFAGSWIERQGAGNFKFVVATTSAGAQKSGADIDIRGARHSLSDLNAAKGQLDLRLAQGARVPKGVYGWYVDVKSNSVVVAIGKGGQQAGIDFVARSGADARTVRFVVEAEQPTLRGTLKGGLGYLRDPGDGYLYACSIGFNVAKGTTPGYVSAGHCGDAGEPAYFEGSSGTGPQWTLGPKIGTFQASNFPNPGQTGNDWSWVAMSTGHSQSPTVYGWGKGDATVKGSTAVGVGGAICRSGRTTGWQCGTVEATGQTVSYSSGETILNLTRTTACSEGGDSGGSFITGPGQAQGVLSGGSGTCRGKHRSSRSYFQPLLPILSAYGLTLKTG